MTVDIARAISAWSRRNNFEPSLRAALIDMDGTLYDSMPLHSQAWAQVCDSIGLPYREGEFFMHEGRTGAATIRLLFERDGRPAPSAGEVAEIYRLKTERFSSLPLPPAMPGAARMLDVLRRAGVERVLVTGSGQGSLIDRLDIDYPGIFAPGMRITSRDVVNGKPHPEPFLRAMKLAGAEPWQSIVIENAPLGVQAGHASGAFTIAVNTGPIPPEELRAAGADLLFPSMDALADAMPEIVKLMRP